MKGIMYSTHRLPSYRPALLGLRALGLALALVACSNDERVTYVPADLPDANDLDVLHIEVLTANPQVAHEFEFETTIKAAMTASEVKVNYYLMSDDVEVAENVAPEQYLLGTVTYPVIEASGDAGRPYQSTLIIPADVAELNHETFFLFAEIDPGGEIHESDELNNHPQEEPPSLVLDDTYKYQPDLVLKRMEFDSTVVILEDHDRNEDTDRVVDGIRDEENHHLGVTVELALAGANPVENADLSFWIRIPGTTNAEAQAVGLTEDHWRLEVWDSDQVDTVDGGMGEYEADYVIDLVQPGDTHSVHLDLLIPSAPAGMNLQANDAAFEELNDSVAAGTLHYDVQVIADVDGSIPEYEDPDASSPNFDDNSLQAQVVVLPVNDEASTGFQLSDDGMTIEALEKRLDWKKEWSNEHFGVGLQLDSLGRVDGRGALASAETAIPMKLFGTGFKLLDLEATAQFVPFDREDSSFQFDFRFAGLTIYTHTGELPELDDWDWDSENSWPKSKSVTSRFTVGIVPMEVHAGVTATLGYDVHVHLGSSFQFDANAIADARATATADATIGILSGGATAELTLLNDTFKARAFAGVDYDPDTDEVLAGLLASATNRLEGPSGRAFLYAEWQGIKWCKRFRIPYPCGHVTNRKEKQLVKWEPYVKEDVLLDFNQQGSGGDPYRFTAIHE